MLLSICVGYAFGYTVKIDNKTQYPFEITIHYAHTDSTKNLHVYPGKVATKDYGAYCITRIDAALLRKGNLVPMVRKTLHPEHTGLGMTCRAVNVELSDGSYQDFTIREK